MKPCSHHKGTLIPFSWNQKEGLGEEMRNILQRVENPHLCSRCNYWVLESIGTENLTVAKLQEIWNLLGGGRQCYPKEWISGGLGDLLKLLSLKNKNDK